MTADLFDVKRRLKAAVPTLTDADAHKAAEAVRTLAPVATKPQTLTDTEVWLVQVLAVRVQQQADNYSPAEGRAIARILAGKDPA